MVKWLWWFVVAYTLYSFIGISAFIGTRPDTDRSFSWIGTADNGNIARNMQFAAFISVHGAFGFLVYFMLLDCERYWRRAVLPVLILSFEYATGSIGVRTDHVPHNVCATIAFFLNLVAALYVVWTKTKNIAKYGGIALIVTSFILLLVFFGTDNNDVCEWVALYIIAALPAYIVVLRSNEEFEWPAFDLKNRKTWIKVFYVIGTLCGCFSAAWELYHIELRYKDKKDGLGGRQNWGSPLFLALYKMFIFTHAFTTFEQQIDRTWLRWVPIIVTSFSFVLWTVATGMAMRYDGQSYAHVLGTTLGGLLLPALLINVALLWPTKEESTKDLREKDDFSSSVSAARLTTLTF